jgi:hypothetical protein
VYRLAIDARSVLRVDLQSIDFDGALALFPAEGPRAIGCVDDTPRGDVHHASLSSTVGPGEYFVVVDGIEADRGTFELFIQQDPLVDLGQVCARATPLAAAMTFRGSTLGAPDQMSATCAGGARGPDHVHSLDLAVPSRVRIRQQTDYDGALYVRARCEDPSTELACNDDFGGNLRSQIAVSLSAGRHFVITDSYSSAQEGMYAIAVERIDEPPAEPESARCAHALALPVVPGRYAIDTFTAPSSMRGSCGGADAPEVLLSVHVDAPSLLRATLEEPELAAAMYLRRGCADAASEITCFEVQAIDRPASAGEPTVNALSAALEPGDYTLVIDGAAPGEMGAADVLLELLAL